MKARLSTDGRLHGVSTSTSLCSLTELSAFPHEKEFLYPSLTFMQPTGVTHTLKHGGTTFTVVEVEPRIRFRDGK
mgnify:CR=1 FL=1